MSAPPASERLGREVRLEGVTKRYGAEAVVRDVDLCVAPGEFVSLLGPSGSGKTTTLMTVAGFAEPDAGRVFIGGEEVTRTPPQARGLGMVIQNYALFPHLDVASNVAFPLSIRRTPRAEIEARVREALATVQLSGFERRKPRELSGGQQQRVALARALVFRPPVVMMDEPLGALDKALRTQMQSQIKGLHLRLGLTVIYVTHDQEEAMNLSDRLAVMRAGRIVQIGPPREVYARPADAFVARFLGDANLLRGRRDGERFVTAGGRALAAPAGAREGGLLFVRPAAVALQAEVADAPGLLARVTRVDFLGGVIRYALDAGEPDPLLCDLPNDGRVLRQVGEAVTATWPPEAAAILSEVEV